MKLRFEKVFERDIDLLMMNKFTNSVKFTNCFLSKIGLSNYDVVEIEHSLTDLDGESDITIVLSNEINKIAILIENKIDAIAMQNQRGRYDIRGQKGIEKGLYDKFYVFIIAPSDYLDSNLEAQKYDNRISYEELIELLSDDFYAVSLLEQAIEEKKKGYVIIENEKVTLFWSKYYNFVRQYYPRLTINEVQGPRGGKANWPYFLTPIKKVYIIHKSNKGYMDLTFSGLGENYKKFIQNVSLFLDSNMSIHKTGKSMAIRLKVPTIDFSQDFKDYYNEMKICLDAAYKLQNLLQKIDVENLYIEN